MATANPTPDQLREAAVWLTGYYAAALDLIPDGEIPAGPLATLTRLNYLSLELLGGGFFNPLHAYEFTESIAAFTAAVADRLKDKGAVCCQMKG